MRARTDLTSRQRQIMTIVDHRGITELFHFTREENLESILRVGLYPRTRLEKNGRSYESNDHERRDGHLDSVSLSISFPNGKLLWKWRHSPENQHARWSILVLKPDILWERSCAFFYTNAANHCFEGHSLRQHMTVRSLRDLFAEEVNGVTRSGAHWLRDEDPTDPQAEVLVFGRISPKRIRRVIVGNRTMCHKLERNLRGLRVILDESWSTRRTKGYFAVRDVYLGDGR